MQLNLLFQRHPVTVAQSGQAVYLFDQLAQAGLNKGEARNALARAVFMHWLGEIRD